MSEAEENFDDWITDCEIVLLQCSYPSCVINPQEVWVDLYLAEMTPEEACASSLSITYELRDAEEEEGPSELDTVEEAFYSSEQQEIITSSLDLSELDTLEREAAERSRRFALARRKDHKR